MNNPMSKTPQEEVKKCCEKCNASYGASPTACFDENCICHNSTSVNEEKNCGGVMVQCNTCLKNYCNGCFKICPDCPQVKETKQVGEKCAKHNINLCDECFADDYAEPVDTNSPVSIHSEKDVNKPTPHESEDSAMKWEECKCDEDILSQFTTLNIKTKSTGNGTVKITPTPHESSEKGIIKILQNNEKMVVNGGDGVDLEYELCDYKIDGEHPPYPCENCKKVTPHESSEKECKHIYNTMPEFKITGELECVKCRLPQNTVGDSLRKQEEKCECGNSCSCHHPSDCDCNNQCFLDGCPCPCHTPKVATSEKECECECHQQDEFVDCLGKCGKLWEKTCYSPDEEACKPTPPESENWETRWDYFVADVRKYGSFPELLALQVERFIKQELEEVYQRGREEGVEDYQLNNPETKDFCNADSILSLAVQEIEKIEPMPIHFTPNATHAFRNTFEMGVKEGQGYILRQVKLIINKLMK